MYQKNLTFHIISVIKFNIVTGTQKPKIPINQYKQRIFASTGNSDDVDLAKLQSELFDDPFRRQFEETEGFAYPASNGLTQTDR